MPNRPKSPHLYLVEDRGYETPCWIWQRASNGAYGYLRRDGVLLLAHRAFYEDHHGPIPEGKQLDHLCRVTLCVNPAHLEPVTQATNTRRGSSTKLTAVEVTEIRLRLAAGETSPLVAADFDITEGHVRMIRCGARWAEAA